jgi:hypothetical protein
MVYLANILITGTFTMQLITHSRMDGSMLSLQALIADFVCTSLGLKTIVCWVPLNTCCGRFGRNLQTILEHSQHFSV